MKKLVSVLLPLLGLAFSAAAQDVFPSKPVRWIVPFAAGGPADAIARLVSTKMGESLGQPIIIENLAGGSNNTGHAAAARAKPDGYTILYVVPSIVLNPAMFKVAVDPIKELDPVAQMTAQPYVLMSRQGFAKTLPGIIEASRKGGVSCANGGGLPFFGCELLKASTKGDFINTTFKGNGPAINALLGGHVDIMVDLTNTALPHLKAGTANAVATTSPTRGAMMPELPVMAETLPGFSLVGWHAVMAPKGTPAPIVAKLNKAIGDALQDPAVRRYLADAYIGVAHGTPAEFGRVIQEDLQKYASITEQAGMKKE